MKTDYLKRKRIAICLMLVMVVQAFAPTLTYGATSGPQQPEFTSFSQVGASDMVDLFTGDLKYNIPLLKVPGVNGDGYPINLFYNTPTNMEQEATCVGFGWNLGIGSITRNVDVVPDDFSGDELKEKTDMRKDWTVGFNIGLSASDVEVIGLELGKVVKFDASASINTTLSYNNYLGYGVSFALGSGVGGGISPGKSDPYTYRGGLSGNLSFSNLDATSWSAGLSLSGLKEQYQLGLGYSKNSLSSKGMVAYNFSTSTGLTNSAISRGLFTSQPLAYPLISTEFTGFNIKAGIKVGVELPIITSIGVAEGGFYKESKLRYKNQWQKSPLYGSMYLQDAPNDQNAVFDYKMEKQNVLRDNQLNLGAPFTAPDRFVVTGQGISGTFSAYRGDVGIYTDKKAQSESSGVDVTFEIRPGGYIKLGADLDVSNSLTDNYVQDLPKQNLFRSNLYNSLSFGFKRNTKQLEYEPFTFKFDYEQTGELVDYIANNNWEFPYNKMNYQYMGYDYPVSLKKTVGNPINVFSKPVYANPNLTNEIIRGFDTKVFVGEGKRAQRIPRKKLIEHYTNGQLKKMGGFLLPEMLVHTSQLYVDTSLFIIPDSSLIARDFGDNKLSAFSIVDEKGKRWNYGLPVVNYIEKDVSFSIWDEATINSCSKIIPNYLLNELANCADRRIDYKMSEKGIEKSRDYLNIRETPAYAKSFLITSTTGPNYVDMNENGPDYADKGEWMRFDYLRVTNDNRRFKWRVPYYGATYQKGSNSLKEDDQAFFKYGERDVYQIREIVSPTHKATFYYSLRGDNLGATCWLQTANPPQMPNDTPSISLKLDSIVLFAGNNYTSNHYEKIKKVGFCYDYSSWPGGKNVISSLNSTGGKLTLKHVWFENYKSKRGAFTPYSFEYHSGGKSPSYSMEDLLQDRWGVYYPFDTMCKVQRAPYTPQFDKSKTPASFKKDMDEAATWYTLKSVTLPSGARINIELERDDYAYLGDQIAGQMFKIAGFKDPDNGTPSNIDRIPVEASQQEDIKIYFRLEEPIDDNDPFKQEKLDRYFEDLYNGKDGKQIFFKLMSFILGPDKPNKEDVSGYAYLKDYGFATARNGKYFHGYFRLNTVSKEIKGEKYHPFLVFAWQNLKNIYRSLLFKNRYGTPNTKEEKINRIWAMLDAFNQVYKGLVGFYTTSINEQRGAKIDLNNSYVRLKSPDQKKYGGGVRVKKIALSNIAGSEFDPTPEYGFVYDYTTTREISGSYIDTISSGVALNEPYIGSEENAYRYVKEYDDQLLANTIDGGRFQEFPINETLLPSPSVGYSKVTVKSLASDYNLERFLAGGAAQAKNGIPANLSELSSTGVTVHEFYTTKDYPFIIDQTPLREGVAFPKLVIIPLIGEVHYNRYVGTQGYMNETNDMAGKPKRVINYGQNKKGAINSVPIRTVEYKYFDKEEVYNEGKVKKRRKRLVNIVPLISNVYYKIDSTHAHINEKAELGVTRQLFSSYKRNTSDDINQVGLHLNLDNNPLLFGLPLPTFTIWPNINYSFTRSTTAVFNKLVTRSGILKEVVVTDEQSTIKTKNIKFDAVCGRPLLTSVQNEFDHEIYDYKVPAYYKYYEMMPGYYNWGYSFKYPSPGMTWWTDLIRPYSYVCKAFEDQTYRFMVTDRPLILRLTRRRSIVQIEIWNRDIRKWQTYRGEIIDLSGEGDERSVDVIVHGGSFPYDKADTVKLTILKSSFGNKLAMDMLHFKALKDPTLRYKKIKEVPANDMPSSHDVVIMDSVIEAEATLYSDFWDAYPYMRLHKGPYLWKSRGNCLVKAKYKYSDNRKYDNLDISHQGGMDSVSIFLPENQNSYTPSWQKWIPIVEVRKINETGMVLSEEDQIANQTSMLDNYFTINGITNTNNESTKPDLFAFSENITAKASNAESYEMAFVSFEDYEVNQESKRISNLKSYDTENRSGWNFLPINEDNTSYEVYNMIPIATVSDTTFFIDKEWPGYDSKYTSSENYTNVGYTSSSYLISNGVVLLPIGNLNYGKFKHRTMTQISKKGCWASPAITLKIDRRLVLISKSTVDNSSMKNTVSIENFGHCGMRCLKLNGGGGDTLFRFHQGILKLHKGKKYYFSCWVNDPSQLDNTEMSLNLHPDLKDAGVRVTIYCNQNNPVVLTPSGNRINGWQKMEGEFLYDKNMSDFDVEFDIGNVANKILYIDDLRLHPLNSEFESYVYDERRKRITEVLDNNNFFTRFKYNEDGDLIAIEKETAKGVYTVQEKIKYLQKRAAPDCSNLNGGSDY